MWLQTRPRGPKESVRIWAVIAKTAGRSSLLFATSQSSDVSVIEEGQGDQRGGLAEAKAEDGGGTDQGRDQGDGRVAKQLAQVTRKERSR